MRLERRWVGLLGVTTFTALWALTVACGDSTTWPETVLSGNPKGSSVGGSSGGPTEVDAGEPDAGDDSGSSELIINTTYTTFCAQIAAQVGGFGKTENVTCGTGVDATVKAPASGTECANLFQTYPQTCTATVQNALNCYTSLGACSGNTDADCAALTTCGGIP